jgi:probable HAF family extracellular repeat protein
MQNPLPNPHGPSVRLCGLLSPTLLTYCGNSAARRVHPIKLRICSVLLITLLVMASSATATPPNGTLQSMKLLTQQVGWTATESRLFWTTDGGDHWRDITPPTHSGQRIASIFFLDVLDGWVLFAGDEENADEPRFEITSTTTAGEQWSSVRSVVIPDINSLSAILSGQGRINFADTLHGWMNLDVVSSANFQLGILLSTEDGGRTWDLTPDSPGVAGSITFISPKLGWLAGGPGGENLYVTRDGSNSWEQLSLKNPASLHSLLYPIYGLPVFKDSKHGLLTVTYSGPEGSKPALVLFATDDGGQSWKIERVLSHLSEDFTGVDVPSTIVGSDLITVPESTGTSLTLTRVGLSGKTSRRTASVVLRDSGVWGLSFASSEYGWILVGGELLSTANRGASWAKITPAGAAHPFASHGDTGMSASVSRKVRSSPSFHRQTSQSDGEFSRADLGFDICEFTTTTKMQTWWDYSPFYDVGVYFGGVSRHCPKNLPANWVPKVESQGWGILPLWAGPQAPCACRNVNGKCVLFPHRFTKDNAVQQGRDEADAAIQSAKNLGLGTIIYYDMEQYDSSGDGGTCGTAVTDFVGSWELELYTKGFAGGVYGAAADANTDWTKSSPLPDAVWISQVPKSGPPNISIWGLSPLCDPFSKKTCFSYWSDWSRIHQYLINQTNVGYGPKKTKVATSVDFNVVDAPDSNSGDLDSESKSAPMSCTKDCTFTYTSIDYPNAKLTNALGINNLGDIVGYYYYLSDARHGFLYSNGQFTTIEYPGAAQTEAWSINDAGEIVGYYIDSNSNFFGFLYSNGQYSSISLGSNTFTVALGINDDGQIAGYYQDSNGYHGFLDNTNNSAITTIDDGGGGTIVRNINGDSLIVGLVQGGTGFLYDSVTGNFVSLGFSVDGVNDSLEMVGGNTLYDYESGSQTPINYPGATGTGAFEINDYTSIVGNWYDSSGGQHGFLATPMQ